MIYTVVVFSESVTALSNFSPSLGGLIRPKTPDLHLKLRYFSCMEVKDEFQSGVIVYTVHYLIRKNQNTYVIIEDYPYNSSRI